MVREELVQQADGVGQRGEISIPDEEVPCLRRSLDSCGPSDVGHLLQQAPGRQPLKHHHLGLFRERHWQNCCRGGLTGCSRFLSSATGALDSNSTRSRRTR